MQDYVQESLTMTIRPLKPLVYNFFHSERPQPSSRQPQQQKYQLFNSQRIQSKNNYFKPTMNHKKIAYQPKFLLSLQKKKSKIITGISQKAESQRLSRNSYRGSKVRTSALIKQAIFNQEQLQTTRPFFKEKDEAQQNTFYQKSLRKSRAPHLNFNLKLILQKRKLFNKDYSRQQNIQGTNYPYYQYFSSTKSTLPMSQYSTRSKTSKTSKTSKNKISNQRYISTTQGLRANILNEIHLATKLF